jgi:hypothetical protein
MLPPKGSTAAGGGVEPTQSQRTRRQAVSAASSGNPGHSGTMTSTFTSGGGNNNSNIPRGISKGVSWGAQSSGDNNNMLNIDNSSGVGYTGFQPNNTNTKTSSSTVGTEGPRNTTTMQPQAGAAKQNIGFFGRQKRNPSGGGLAAPRSMVNGGRSVVVSGTGNSNHRHAHFGGLGSINRGRSDASVQSYTEGAKEVFCCFFTCGLNHRDRGNKTCDQFVLESMAKLSNSHAWMALRMFCAFIMIFGEEFQKAFFPQQWDTFFFILFIVVLAIVIADMIILICVDPTYFLWTCCPGCGRCRSKRSCCCCARYAVDGEKRPLPKGKQESCQFGSFMFWLDLISVISFIDSIPYLRGWDTLQIIVTMGSNGDTQVS